ncbi:thiol reductant ABC exporter subunit CydD [Actinomadura sp. DC4]|uniref:thiol reductant ABC exporter subunit CydD n=1 Tax=Actinomadura sp. DC4 TaxID=3055069 RepID=UPI0025B029F1|nr:thiol reductant ABC exporter subunit CydD [Actinomadura sp. DC4]MDN3359765.1 thiol reductant ABC exporter subunit CydD [Actinomadura sp. DC4]
MRPLDPRLLRYADAARVHLIGTVALGAVVTGLVLAQAGLLAHALAGAGPRTATLAALAAVIVARALASYGGEVSALRAAATVKSQLRRKLVTRALPGGTGKSAGEVVTLATRGLDALDAYFARYLPQLVLACLTPLAVLAVVGGTDLLSAVVIAVTLPLIPIFMILVGLHTRARTERQWHLLERLGGHFLDVVEGLPTLKVFGRAKAQARVIRDITDAHRRATMSTLRVAFLSALVLELLSTLAVALVAVEVGLRLLAGGMRYETALFVLLLAPEAYLPLRAVGAQFHASMEGVTAAQSVFDVLEAPLPESAPGDGHADLTRDVIRLDDVSVRHPGGSAPVLDHVSLAVRPGERVVVTGPSGAGKSTLLSVLLRFAEPAAGHTSFADVPADDWRTQIAWVPQHPHLFAATVADNIRLGADASAEEVRRAARLAGADGFIDELPAAYDTDVGEHGLRLSAGQRQRIALARAFLRDAPLLLLDEPTAHLDGQAARTVRDAVERLMAGRTVVLVTHDHAWTRHADRVVTLDAGRLTEPEMAA